MITQVELKSSPIEDEQVRVYWLRHSPYDGQVLRLGQHVQLAENSIHWIVKSIWVSLPDNAELPPKAREATILVLN